MALQDRDALVIDALSILGDKSPQPPLNQPKLDDGIHLRWSPGKNRGFSTKAGYYLFRRRTDAPVCFGPRFKSRSVAELQTLAVLTTDVGTLSTTTAKPFGVAATGAVVEGIVISEPDSLRFEVPAGVKTRKLSLRLRFLPLYAGFSQRFDAGGKRELPAPVVPGARFPINQSTNEETPRARLRWCLGFKESCSPMLYCAKAGLK